MIQERFYDNLIKHYKTESRQLPWRNTQDPYSIWVSEVILQQTRVNQGLGYFMTFLRYFPDVQALANATETEVLKVWQGLGYYSRALNMHSAAKQVVNDHNGVFPSQYEIIKQLKGVGDYTAAAIASIAFHLPYAAVDGNVKRVASRIYGFYEPLGTIASTKLITNKLNEEILNHVPGEFNQAFMDLGATICTPTNPACHQCPMSIKCFAFLKGVQKELPVKTAKKKPLEMHLQFLFLEHNGFTYIQRRNKQSIWKGLYEFVNEEGIQDTYVVPSGFFKYFNSVENITVKSIKKYTHKLTHRTIFATFWHLSGLPANIVKEMPDLEQIRIGELSKFPVHRLMHRYLVEMNLLDT